MFLTFDISRELRNTAFPPQEIHAWCIRMRSRSPSCPVPRLKARANSLATRAIVSLKVISRWWDRVDRVRDNRWAYNPVGGRGQDRALRQQSWEFWCNNTTDDWPHWMKTAKVKSRWQGSGTRPLTEHVPPLITSRASFQIASLSAKFAWVIHTGTLLDDLD